MSKWKLINELLERLNGKNFHDFLTEDLPKELKPVYYAPHISYYAWIFEYKGVYICFMDQGNGWWQFYSAVGYLDVLKVKFEEWKVKRRVERKRRKGD